MRSQENLVAACSEYYTYSPSVQARESFLYALIVGDFVYEPGYDLQRDRFDSFLLELILDGSVTGESDGETWQAEKGDVVLLDCYRPHHYHSKTGWRALWMHFDGASARGYYNVIHRSNGIVFSARRIRKDLRALDDIYDMFHREKAPNELQIALSMTKMLTAMAEPLSARTGVHEKKDSIDEVLYYINEHISEELPVKQLAQLASFSEYHFIRVFHDAVGMTPRQYIKTVRMNQAKYLLKTTDLPIQEIGYSTGYSSLSMFCTTFKNSQGVTPSEFREGGLRDISALPPEI